MTPQCLLNEVQIPCFVVGNAVSALPITPLPTWPWHFRAWKAEWQIRASASLCLKAFFWPPEPSLLRHMARWKCQGINTSYGSERHGIMEGWCIINSSPFTPQEQYTWGACPALFLRVPQWDQPLVAQNSWAIHPIVASSSSQCHFPTPSLLFLDHFLNKPLAFAFLVGNLPLGKAKIIRMY